MKTEIEVKFLNIDIDEMRDKLKAAGASREQPMRLMRRALIETPEMRDRDGFLRVRDEGDKTTLTFKQFTENSLTGAKEREIVVSDFSETIAILAECGLNHHTLQETRRETWRLDGVEIVIDEWPWISPYIEIEGDSAESVRAMADRLGFNWSEAVFGSVDVIYNRQYPNMTVRGVIDIAKVSFADAVPAEFGQKVS
ncbi:MAG: class IV adenylate cyclase [Psychrobacter sp.]